jgi:hypothetical protein
MKTCIRCENEKAESEFGRNAAMDDGLSVYCRVCVREKAKEYRGTAGPREKKTADIRVYGRAYRAANLEKFRERDRQKYARKMKKLKGDGWVVRPNSPMSPEERREKASAAHRARRDHLRATQPEKWAARHNLQSAVYKGTIKRLPCMICGEVRSEGHHPDYSAPRDVVWLCRRHHRQLHKEHAEMIDKQENGT